MGYRPIKNNMYYYNMKFRLKESESFRNVFRYDLTKPILNDLKDIANPKHRFTQNTIINLSGQTGEGKSTAIISLAKQIFPNFSYKNIFFFDQEILDNVKNFPKDTILIRDENPQKSVFGVGSNRTSSQISVLAETCRASGLNLAFVEPSFVQMDISKLILETVDMDMNQRITRLAVRDTRSFKYMGAIYIKILPDDDSDIIKYTKVKNKFIEDMRNGKMSGAKMDYRDIVLEVLKELDIDKYRTKKERRTYLIAENPTYTSGEIEIISTLLEVALREAE